MKRPFFYAFSTLVLSAAIIALSAPASAQGRRPGGHGSGGGNNNSGTSMHRPSTTVTNNRPDRTVATPPRQDINRNVVNNSNNRSTSTSGDNRNRGGNNGGGNYGNGNHRPGGGNNTGGGSNYGNGNRRPGGGNNTGGSNYGNDNRRPGGGNNTGGGSNYGNGNHRPGGGNNTGGGSNYGNGNHRPGGDNHRPGGGNYRPGGDNHRPGGGNYRPGGDNHRPGGSGYNRPPVGGPHHGGINHGGPRPDYNRYRWQSNVRPRGPHDRWYDYYRYNRWSWRTPIAPPYRIWRPRVVWYYRPVIPTGYRFYASAPIISGVLGLEFGTYLDASLNFLYYNGYDIDGYQDNVVYLRDVNMMGYSWPDVLLQYDDNGGMCYAEFVTSASYNDDYRFRSVYNSLCTTFGPPINIGNGHFSWYGRNGNGYVNLNTVYENGRHFTVLTFGV